MKTSELYNQFQKELTKHLEDWVSDQFAKKICEIDNINKKFYIILKEAYETPIGFYVDFYSFYRFKKHLKFYLEDKQKYLDGLLNNFVAGLLQTLLIEFPGGFEMRYGDFLKDKYFSDIIKNKSINQ